MITLKDQYGSFLNYIGGDFSADDFSSDDFFTWTILADLPVSFISASEVKESRRALIEIPSGSVLSVTEYIQDMGTKNRVFQVKGSILLQTADIASGSKVGLRDLPGTSGSILSNYIPETSIYYKSVTIEDKENEPYRVDFTLEATEIK